MIPGLKHSSDWVLSAVKAAQRHVTWHMFSRRACGGLTFHPALSPTQSRRVWAEKSFHWVSWKTWFTECKKRAGVPGGIISDWRLRELKPESWADVVSHPWNNPHPPDRPITSSESWTRQNQATLLSLTSNHTVLLMKKHKRIIHAI